MDISAFFENSCKNVMLHMDHQLTKQALTKEDVTREPSDVSVKSKLTYIR